MGYPFPAKPFFQPPRQAIAAKGGAPTIAPSKAPLREEGTAATKKLSECRVLVVDDTSDNVLFLSMCLRNAVKKVDTAETASEAIAKITAAAGNGKYDVVLCDMRLDSDMTGFDVEKKAKELIPGAKFVFVTGLDRYSFMDIFPNQEYPSLILKKPCRKEAILELLGGMYPG